MDKSLIERLREQAQEEEDEARAWNFEGRDGEPANKTYLNNAAVMREAAALIEELQRVDELYDELSEVIVGAKMIPPLVPLLALKKDAERYRYIRDRMPRPETGQPMWIRRGEDLDEAVDAAMRESR